MDEGQVKELFTQVVKRQKKFSKKEEQPKRPEATVERLKQQGINKLPSHALDYVPKGEETCVVRPFICQGKVYQDFDVYIDGYINNEYYSLDKSPWANPYYKMLRAGHVQHALQKYEQHIRKTPKLFAQLHTLKGKRLGAFSHPDYKTHAEVLIKLLSELDEDNESEASMLPVPRYKYNHISNFFFFKGKTCPLSNLYPCSLEYEGHEFISAHHAFQWEKSRALSLQSIEGQMLSLKTFDELRKLTHQLQSTPGYFGVWEDDQATFIMYKILQAKLSSCPQFVEMLEEYPESYFAESTTNAFWGINKDIKNIRLEDDNEIYECQGKNVMGWLLKAVSFSLKGKKASDIGWFLHTLSFEGKRKQDAAASKRDVKKPINEGLQLLVGAGNRDVKKPIYEGLKLVAESLKQHSC